MTGAQPLGSNYWKLWTGSVVSNLGDGVGMVAYPWLASAITRDPLSIALVTVATRLPWLLFTLPAGVITDRVDRRRLVAWMDVARFAITLVVAAFVLVNQPHLSAPTAIAGDSATPPESATVLLAMIYVTGLLLGTAEVFRDNGAQTLLPSVVPAAQLQRANGRLWGAEMVMNQFAGPVLGGALLATALSLPFFLDAGTFAVAAGMTFLVVGEFRPRGAAGRPITSFRGQMAEGFRWLWTRPFLRSLAISLGVLNLLGMMTLATFVLFVQEILALGATGFGVMMWAGAVGGIIGSVTAERVTARLGNGTTLFLTILTGSVTALVIGLTSSAAVVFAMSLLTSLTAVLWNVITVSLRQTIIPDHLLGRVNSVYRLFGWGMIPLGSLLGGALVALGSWAADRSAGLRLPFLVSAVMHLVLFVYTLPRLGERQIRAALDEQPDQEAE